MDGVGAIELRGVSRRFKDVVAVDAVDLRVEPGEFFTVLGPSGCGKSTMLRMVAGLERLDGGQVLLRGLDVTSLPPEQRDVSTVFQDYALFPHLTVIENVLFPLKMKRVPRSTAEREAQDALELVELGELRDRKVTNLSGGQRQRTALARSLVWQPEALLLDEPLAALDFRLRLEMQTMLKDLQRAVGITFLFVTHDQTEAFRLSDRIAVMRNGRLEQVGTSQELYYSPASLFVGTFIGQMNTLRGTVVERNSHHVSIRCGDSIVRGRTPKWEPALGGEVIVGVRPEFVEWRATDHDITPTNSTNELSCRVLEVAFQGSMLETTVAIPGQPSWAHVTIAGTEATSPTRDVPVTLTWDPDQTWIFRDESIQGLGKEAG